MGLLLDWLQEHTLAIMLLIGAVIAAFWLLHFRKTLRMSVPAVVICSVIHVILAVSSAILFGFMEQLGEPEMQVQTSLFGGLFFMPIFYLIGAKLTKRAPKDVLDIFAICAISTAMCARINCLIAGCCLGLPLPFPGMEHLRWPTREMELIFYVVLLIFLCPKVWKGKTYGQIYPIYMIAYGIFRLIVETLRVADINNLFHLSHVWALICLVIGVSIYIELSRKHNKKKKVRR